MRLITPTVSFTLSVATRIAQDADDEIILVQEGGSDDYQLVF